jgi:hypothetical protein
MVMLQVAAPSEAFANTPANAPPVPSGSSPLSRRHAPTVVVDPRAATATADDMGSFLTGLSLGF